ncbi:MAG: MotA/TolQ/ExbB proton channel family protein [Sandaracinaceae bacterium]|nr:MotA/TolQ/ExbB proton channel family protein [Sandaracinaceae bacterium]
MSFISTLAQHYEEGGWAMHMISLFLLISWSVIIERAIYLFKSSKKTDAIVERLQKCIQAGDIPAALRVCTANDAPVTRIIKAGLQNVAKSDEAVQSAMDEEALKELPKIEKRTGYLALLSNLTMLSGLLGTVLGLIGAFGAVGSGADAATKALVLAQGISEAMNCTAYGLFAAINALIGFALLNGKTQAMLDDISAATVQVMNLVTGNRDKIKSHASAPSAAA